MTLAGLGAIAFGVIETQQNPVELPQSLANPSHVFTTENARIMAARSWEKRRQRKLERENNPQPEPQASGYVALRLLRVRKQLDRLDELMMTEKDAQKLDRLASAQARLSEQERVLDGRPLPGSRRPGKEAAPSLPEVEPLG